MKKNDITNLFFIISGAVGLMGMFLTITKLDLNLSIFLIIMANIVFSVSAIIGIVNFNILLIID